MDGKTFPFKQRTQKFNCTTTMARSSSSWCGALATFATVSFSVQLLACISAIYVFRSWKLEPGLPLSPEWSRAVIAHRGGAAYAPENTVLGFAASKEAGATAVEFDMQITRDNRCVLMHDFTIDRTTNGSGSVADMTLAELGQFSIKHGEKIPTCGDAINAARALGLNMVLEVKELHKRTVMVKTLIRLFTTLGPSMFDAAVVASFDPRFLHELRAADSRFRTLLFFAPHPVHTLCRMTGTIRPSATVCLFAPWIDTVLEWSVASWMPTFLGVSVVGPRHTGASPRMIEHWAQQQIATNVWVVNEPLSKQYFQSIGAMITTDCPMMNETCAAASH